MVKGKPAIVIEHVTRLREDLRPEWPQPAQPAARTGSRSSASRHMPSTSVRPAARATTTTPPSRRGAGRVVNAIPAVVAAPPGIRTTLDLPLVTGKGLFAAN